MPTSLNRLREEWRQKRPTFGAIATILSIQTVQIMARSGLDWSRPRARPDRSDVRTCDDHRHVGHGLRAICADCSQ